MRQDSPRVIQALLVVAVAALCGGYAWQAWRWGTPVFSILWDQSLLEGPVAWYTGMDWQTWAASPRVEAFGTAIGHWWSLVFLVGVVAALSRPWIEEIGPALGWPVTVALWSSAGGLGLWSVLGWVDSGYEWPQIAEHASQYLAPLLLLWVHRCQERWWRTLAMIALAGTFCGHACYALGWPRTPGAYLTMLMNGLGVEQRGATIILHSVGLLDLLAVLGLIWSRTRPAALLWMVVWGLATAAARLAGNLDAALLASGLEQWLHQAGLRLVHGLLPLALLLLRHPSPAGTAREIVPVTPTPSHPPEETRCA